MRRRTRPTTQPLRALPTAKGNWAPSPHPRAVLRIPKRPIKPARIEAHQIAAERLRRRRLLLPVRLHTNHAHNPTPNRIAAAVRQYITGDTAAMVGLGQLSPYGNTIAAAALEEAKRGTAVHRWDHWWRIQDLQAHLQKGPQ